MCPVDLISIDRRSLDQEAECLERATVLAKQFLEKVRDTEDHVWKPAGSDTAPAQTERCVCVFKFGLLLLLFRGLPPPLNTWEFNSAVF